MLRIRYKIMQKEKLIDELQSKIKRKRLSALAEICRDDSESVAPDQKTDLGLQFRSVYSGFTFTPSMCAYKSLQTGAPVTAMVDYASLKGAKEFMKALKLTGETGFVGAGIKARTKGMRLSLQALGVPEKNYKLFHKSLAKARNLKAEHVEKLRKLINEKLSGLNFFLPPELSLFKKNTTASAERLYNALANKILLRYGNGDEITAFLTNRLKFPLTEEQKNKLDTTENNYYRFDLAEILRAYLGVKDVPETTVPAADFVSLCESVGAIPTAVYTAGTPLDEFITVVKKLGVKAICLEPDRNNGFTPEEFYDEAMAENLLPLARKVIDRPRKKADYKFASEETAKKYVESAFAVCGHEIAVSVSLEDGLFSEKTIASMPDMRSRIDLFYRMAIK